MGTRANDIQVAIHPDATGVVLRVWHEAGKQWVVTPLTGDEASKLAARLILANAVSGASGSALLPVLTGVADRITNIIDELTDWKVVKDEASACPECGRAIYNKANMARHLAAHGVQE